ncbi:MAG: heparinase II/III domain-containing protein [Syntrophomonadaceae bacterium]
MTKIPATERMFEHKVNIKRIDLFDFNLEALSDFISNLDNRSVRELISVADKAMNGIITGFSSIELDYGNPINWHINPLTGFENSRTLKWYKIPDFDKKVGDIKVIWEASRLTHFLFFARAYLITGNRKYYIAFSEQLEDWLTNNPYSYGSNYKCGQEATLRMTNILIAYSVFNGYGLTTEKDKKHIFGIVEGSYKKVLSNFFYAHKCIKNNHTFTEILGLIIGAWCSEDSEQLNEAYQLMDKEIIRQFLPDGGFTQYSFNYHRFTLQILECLYKVSEKTGIYITETERIRNSVLMLYQVQAESGDVPNYGSNDGALIFPLSTCKYRDFRPVLNTMYALIEGKRLYNYGAYDEELLWFGKSIELPLDYVNKKAGAYNDSGLYILRHKDGFLMTCLQNYKSRPAHMDQLHLDVWHKGINIFCDNGTYSYASELGIELSSTIGHNSVKLPGIEQMNKRGAFLVTEWTKRELTEYSDSNFCGKMVSQNGYIHERKITKNNNSYFIEDKVISKADICEFIFHTPCEVQILRDGFLLLTKNKEIAIVKTEGDIKIKESYRSLYYLKKEIINRIIVTQKTKNGSCETKLEIILL